MAKGPILHVQLTKCTVLHVVAWIIFAIIQAKFTHGIAQFYTLVSNYILLSKQAVPPLHVFT